MPKSPSKNDKTSQRFIRSDKQFRRETWTRDRRWTKIGNNLNCLRIEKVIRYETVRYLLLHDNVILKWKHEILREITIGYMEYAWQRRLAGSINILSWRLTRLINLIINIFYISSKLDFI